MRYFPSGNLEVCGLHVFASVRINIEAFRAVTTSEAATKLSSRFSHELATSGIEGDKFTGDRSRLGERNIRGRKE